MLRELDTLKVLTFSMHSPNEIARYVHGSSSPTIVLQTNFKYIYSNLILAFITIGQSMGVP